MKKNAFIARLAINFTPFKGFNRRLQKMIHQLAYFHMNFFMEISLEDLFIKYHLNYFCLFRLLIFIIFFQNAYENLFTLILFFYCIIVVILFKQFLRLSIFGKANYQFIQNINLNY